MLTFRKLTQTKTNREATYNVVIIVVTSINLLVIFSLGTKVKSEQYDRNRIVFLQENFVIFVKVTNR